MNSAYYGSICTAPSSKAACCCNCCCPVIGERNVFDMTLDPCGKDNWQECKAQIYGSCSSGPCWRPSCRFPPRRCPPPPPPPLTKCAKNRCNPNRSCGFIIKETHPGRRICRSSDCEMPGCCSCPAMNVIPGCCGDTCCSEPNPRVSVTGCRGSPLCCPVPDPLPFCRSRSVCCRPIWRHAPGKSVTYCPNPPPLPPRSMSYKTWLCQIGPRVDTNICPSRQSAQIENCGCTMVVVDPPAQCCC